MRNMDKWLGSGGMPLIKLMGASFDSYGLSEKNLGWVKGSWEPTEICLNVSGTVQAGVQAVLLDALMNFAANTSLDGKDRTKATLEMKIDLLRPALKDEKLGLYGCITHLTRQVAFAYSEITNEQNEIISRSTGTFLLKRDQ
jgi:uncharacterized protein (TIGR00369 family)